MRYTGLIERYRDRLPVGDKTRLISLGEGNTPLIRLENIPCEMGTQVKLYIKYEGLNPTGSFKDRGMTMAVTKAVESGSKVLYVRLQETLLQLQQHMQRELALKLLSLFLKEKLHLESLPKP